MFNANTTVARGTDVGIDQWVRSLTLSPTAEFAATASSAARLGCPAFGRGDGFAEAKRWFWRIFSKHIGTLVMPSVCLERCTWHKSQ